MTTPSLPPGDPTAKAKKNISNAKKGCGGCLGVFVGLVVLAAACGHNTPAKPSASASVNAGTASETTTPSAHPTANVQAGGYQTGHLLGSHIIITGNPATPAVLNLMAHDVCNGAYDHLHGHDENVSSNVLAALHQLTFTGNVPDDHGQHDTWLSGCTAAFTEAESTRTPTPTPTPADTAATDTPAPADTHTTEPTSTHSDPPVLAPQPTHQQAGCTTDSHGNCIVAGRYCPNSAHGDTGIDGIGQTLRCEDNNGWRWERV